MVFGLSTMSALTEVDQPGRYWLEQLEYYDERLTAIARHMQPIGYSPRKSRRYWKLVQRVRGFVKTEVNRINSLSVQLAAAMDTSLL